MPVSFVFTYAHPVRYSVLQSMDSMKSTSCHYGNMDNSLVSACDPTIDEL